MSDAKMEPVVDQEKPKDASSDAKSELKKQRHLEQLAAAREKNRLKRKEKDERLENLEKRLSEQLESSETPAVRPAKAPKKELPPVPVFTPDEEEQPEPAPKAPRVVTREPSKPVATQPEQASFSKRVRQDSDHWRAQSAEFLRGSEL